MNNEDKELLLKDLCGRLPYKRLLVDYCYNAFNVHKGHYKEHGSKCILDCYLLDVFISPRQNEKGEYIKPYLRPLSYMTEEESAELSNIISEWFDKELFDLTEEPFLEYALSKINYSISPLLFDWLNKNMFDYRGLIEKGLAIKVTKENNPYKPYKD